MKHTFDMAVKMWAEEKSVVCFIILSIFIVAF